MGPVLRSLGSSFGTPTSTENPRIYGLPVHYHQVPLKPGLGVDLAFRRQAALSKDLNWSRINPTLYSLCFAGKAKKSAICIHCLSNNHNSDQRPEIQNMWPSQCSLFLPAYTGPFPGPAVPVTPAVEKCRLFNAKGESRCRYKRCRYLHARARCRVTTLNQLA